MRGITKRGSARGIQALVPKVDGYRGSCLQSTDRCWVLCRGSLESPKNKGNSSCTEKHGNSEGAKQAGDGLSSKWFFLIKEEAVWRKAIVLLNSCRGEADESRCPLLGYRGLEQVLRAPASWPGNRS